MSGEISEGIIIVIPFGLLNPIDTSKTVYNYYVGLMEVLYCMVVNILGIPYYSVNR